MSVDFTAFRHARLERYAYLTAATFLGYEYFLQLGNEVELFWKKRWSFGKCLFLWSRYYSLGFNINNAIMFMNERPSLEVSTNFFHWQNTGAALQVITTHLILQLRIYAMYGSTRLMLGVCITLTTLEAIAFGVIFGYPRQGLVATNEPSSGLFICADADPAHAHWITYYWITVVILDTILLGLSMFKGWQMQRSGLGGGLMSTLTRDSVFYFLVIFCVYSMNTVLWFLNVITLDELGTGYAFTVSAVLANRLLITVREKYYYHHGELEDWGTFTSMRFQSSPALAPEEAIAMETFGAVTTRFSRWEGATTHGGYDDYDLNQYSETRGF